MNGDIVYQGREVSDDVLTVSANYEPVVSDHARFNFSHSVTRNRRELKPNHGPSGAPAKVTKLSSAIQGRLIWL